MIIEKTYMFDEIPIEENKFPMTLRDYHRTIITKFIKEGYEFYKKGISDYVIVTGIDGILAIEDHSAFSINPAYYLQNISAPRGLLSGKTVYYDIRLEADKVIFGSNITEVNHYIITKGRKEKLKKLNRCNI